MAGFLVKLINPEIPNNDATTLIPEVIVNTSLFQSIVSTYPGIVSKMSLFHMSLGIFLVLVICLSVGIYFQNYFGGWISTRVTMDLRKMISEHLLSLDFTYFVKSRSGDLMTRISGDLASYSNS